MIDFIIVGRGLAACTLAHTFYNNQLSFQLVGTDNLSSCSRVAAGIWNPIVFKRLTKSWLASDLLPYLRNFYGDCERSLQQKIVTERPLLKPFTEDQEKTLWLKKAAGELSEFLEDRIYEKQDDARLEHFHVKNDYGCVRGAGNLDVAGFMDATTAYFADSCRTEVFDYSQLQVFPDKVVYKNITAKSIVFCEGVYVKNNPFFNWVPLNPAKGEIFTIKADNLKLRQSIFNRNGFIMDIADGVYKAGATYAWDDLEQNPSHKGAEELHQKIDSMIQFDYHVLKHEAGIRPSSIDRRPIIGPHPAHRNLFVFNGLGTKGVMLAPYFAANFVNFCLHKQALHKEVDVSRFYDRYQK